MLGNLAGAILVPVAATKVVTAVAELGVVSEAVGALSKMSKGSVIVGETAIAEPFAVTVTEGAEASSTVTTSVRVAETPTSVQGAPVPLPDKANVVRGGLPTPENIAKSIGPHPVGIEGFSVESAAGKTVEQLAIERNLPNGKIGTTTAGEIRKAGGEITTTPGASPNHATVSGLSPEKASELLNPAIDNPAKKIPK